MKADCSLGIDVGSVSTNLVMLDKSNSVVNKVYLRTEGRPAKAIIKGLRMLSQSLQQDVRITASGATGSGRMLAGVLAGADAVKNEITAHAAASVHIMPEVRTIIEIGGQDSKIILIRDGLVHDFAMNTVCAAGTGSFLDRQASRLMIPIEEFGDYALRAVSPVRIAGRCAVFAESDMINKQQTGHCSEDIIAGLCDALVRNYLNNVGKGKKIEEPVMFQGGVAANSGICAAFEKVLGTKVIIPEHYDVMGAFGAALIAVDEMKNLSIKTRFRGFDGVSEKYEIKSFECTGCPNMCEVVRITLDGKPAAYWGGRCGKWSSAEISECS